MIPEEVGAIAVKYDEPLIAGRLVSIVFEYTVGKAGLAQNGKLRIGLPSVAWALPEVPQYYFWSEYAKGKERCYTEYDRVNTTVRLQTEKAAVPLLESEARFRKPWSYPTSWLRDYDRYWITVTMEDAGLEAGDKIILTYGDPAQRPLTARVQSFPEEKLCFLAFVDLQANGQFEEVPGSPWMTRVHAGPASQLKVIAPSITQPTQKPKLHVAYTDEVIAQAQPVPQVETLELGVVDGQNAPRSVAVNRDGASILFDAPELSTPRQADRAIRIQVQDAANSLTGSSNPALNRPQGYRLFWGDLHGQSKYHCWNPEEQVGISCGSPAECLQYARDIAGLDFCAVTDTSSILNDIWEDTVQAALDINEPGRFIAFQGSEVGDSFHGHRNLIFAGDQPEPGFEGKTINEAGTAPKEKETPRMHERYAGRKDVILIPHHTKMWLNWDWYDPSLEPVLEIYSIWGSGEKRGTDLWGLREMTGGAQEAWARGYKLGVIGGSDTHAGMPGRSIAGSDRDDFLCYKAGYAAVWANELTRSAIFQALKARRCYATTGVRIILETFIDGNPMGSELPWPDKSATLEFAINAWGTCQIDTISVVKNNVDVHTFRLTCDHAQLIWPDRSQVKAGDYYYVRLIQRDGNRAWSSPIWIIA